MWTNYNHYNPMPIRPNVSSQPFVTERITMSKRKWQFYFPDEEVKPSKILVTEDMMANQLDGLHLSTTYTSHGVQPSQPLATPSTSGTSPLSQNFSPNFSSGSLPKLTMCDELRSLKDSFSILPKVLEPERPTKALILWQPPAGDLGKILQKKMEEQKEKEAPENKDEAGPSEVEIDKLPLPETPKSSPVEPTMDVELENNNTEMTCAYSDSGFSRAV